MALQECHDGRDVHRDEDAETDAQYGTEGAEGQPLCQEDLPDLAAGHAHGAQDGDVAPFFGDDHVHRGEQAKGCDHDDEAEDDEHRVLLGLHRAEVGGVVHAPVARIHAVG